MEHIFNYLVIMHAHTHKHILKHSSKHTETHQIDKFVFINFKFFYKLQKKTYEHPMYRN